MLLLPLVFAIVLEERLLGTPALALEQAKREILRMTEHARRSLQCAIDALINGDTKQIEMTRKLEDKVDEFQFQITSYLVTLSERQLSEEVSRELPVLLHMVNDLERIGDHAVNISEIAERKLDIKFTFTEYAKNEGDEMIRETFAMFDNIMLSLEKEDIQAAHRSLQNETNLNRMQLKFRRSHVQRMTDGICTAESGLIFIDVVDNLEKIGDHLTNIAESIIGGVQWTGVKSSSLSGEFKALTSE
jgi:phosphate:Na+ symporter